VFFWQDFYWQYDWVLLNLSRRKTTIFMGRKVLLLGNFGIFNLNDVLFLRNNNQPTGIAFKRKISILSRLRF